MILRGALAGVAPTLLARYGVVNLEGALAKGVEKAGGHMSTVAAAKTNLRVNGRN